MNRAFTESVVEQDALAWLEGLGWKIAYGPDISPGGDTLTLPLFQKERESCAEVVLAQRLRDAVPTKLISGAMRVKDTEKMVGVAI